jgi:hypothetical protein
MVLSDHPLRPVSAGPQVFYPTVLDCLGFLLLVLLPQVELAHYPVLGLQAY